MGFGSYDESEQQEVNADFDDDEAVQSAQNEHHGSIEFENGASSGELLDRLQEIKGDPE